MGVGGIRQISGKTNILIHNILSRAITSTHQKMRMTDIQTFLKVDLQQDASVLNLYELLSGYSDLFHIHSDTNKIMVSVKKFNNKSAEAYIALGDNIKIVKNLPDKSSVPLSRDVTIEVKDSRSETIMLVSNLIGRMVPGKQAMACSNSKKQRGLASNTCTVLFRVSEEPGTVFSVQSHQGSFHNKSPMVTFNLQKTLHTICKTEVKFGVVPGRHKSAELETPHQSFLQLVEETRKGPTGKCVPSVKVKASSSTEHTVNKSQSESLEKVAVTKILFFLLSKPNKMLQHNVVTLFDGYLKLNIGFKKKEVLMLIRKYSTIFHLEGDMIGLQSGWVRHFFSLGRNLTLCKIPKCQVDEIPVMENILNPDIHIHDWPKKHPVMTIRNVPVSIQQKPGQDHLRAYLRLQDVVMYVNCPTNRVAKDAETVHIAVHLSSVIKKLSIEFMVTSGKKPTVPRLVEVDAQTPEEDFTGKKEIPDKQTNKYGAKPVKNETNSSIEIGLASLVFHILSSQAQTVKRLSKHDQFKVYRNVLDFQDNTIGLQHSWIQDFLPLASNIWECETGLNPQAPDKVGFLIESTGTPMLTIPNIPAIVTPPIIEDHGRTVFFKLSLDGPTYFIGCTRRTPLNTSTISLSLCESWMLKKSTLKFLVKGETTLEDSLIKAGHYNQMKTDEETPDAVEDWKNSTKEEDEVENETSEHIMSSPLGDILTIGNEDTEGDNIETAEDAMEVYDTATADTAKETKENKKESCSVC